MHLVHIGRKNKSINDIENIAFPANNESENIKIDNAAFRKVNKLCQACDIIPHCYAYPVLQRIGFVFISPMAFVGFENI